MSNFCFNTNSFNNKSLVLCDILILKVTLHIACTLTKAHTHAQLNIPRFPFVMDTGDESIM